jgi:purine nucleosidase
LTWIVDTDTGSDDAVALLMALRSPGFDVEAITVVAGNVELEKTVQNALYTVELCESDVPVYAGAPRPLVRDLTTAIVHGDDGMGDIGLDLSGRRPADGHAVLELVRRARERAGDLDLVTLGPLTNVALALTLEPELPRLIRRCVVMGGVGCGFGNVTPVSEFNIWVDPEAARIVFRSGLAIEMVGWDVSIHDAFIGRDEAAKLRALGTRYAEFAIDIQRVLLEFITERLGKRGFDLPDPAAMAVALDADIATDRVRRAVDVELGEGPSRGQTVVDHLAATGLEPNVDVVLAVDRERFRELLRNALT